MFSDVKRYLIYQVMNAPVRTYPFPHLRIEHVFPDAFYDKMLGLLPSDSDYMRLVDTKRVSPAYSPRRLSLFPEQIDRSGLSGEKQAFWRGTFRAINDAEFSLCILSKFKAAIEERFVPRGEAREPMLSYRSEAFLMRDLSEYSLGPHTDSPSKLVSVLFYLPPDDDRPELGTSLYIPKDRAFTCPGGPHHPFEQFERVATMPYRRNTLVAFPKTLTCFHGVEPVPPTSARRDLLLFDLKGNVTFASAA